MQLQPALTAGPSAAAGDYSSSSSAALGRVTRSSTKRSIKLGVQLHAAFLSGLSSLTMLQLTECSLAGWAQELAALSALTQPQHLQLKHIHRDDRSDESHETGTFEQLDFADRAAEAHAREVSEQLRVALPHLTALTYLYIKQHDLTCAALQGLGRLQQLRELRVKHIKKDGQTSRVYNQTIARLSSSLSLLHISVWHGLHAPVVLNSRSISTLQQLRSLRHLALPGMQVQDVTGFMGALSQITSLSLKW
jgi:hypothetical protein